MSVSIISENDEWKPYNYSLAIEKNSVMDFSYLVPDKIAGEDGWVVVDDNGHLVFDKKPDKRLKFYGVNVCFGACFPQTKDECDIFCDTLLRRGYNSVRIHHYDAGLVGDDFRGKNAVNSYTFNEEHLDQFDYLFASLKKRGIYISTDLYTYRPFKAEEIPEYGKDCRMEIKPLIPLYDSAIEAWSRFALNLFNHVNPYTGVAYKDDPTLFSLCLVNEDTLLKSYSLYPDIKEIYLQRFSLWLDENGYVEKEGDDSLFGRFLAELQINANRKMTDILRSNGINCLITGANYWDLIATCKIREDFDYVDTHVYWDHPEFMVNKGKLPYDHHQQRDVERLAMSLRTVNVSRIYGKPFVMTEFNGVYPNHYRAESGVVFGAYMALQDWDGAFRFDYANSRESAVEPVLPGSWAIATDPIGLLNDRIITLSFLRGDVEGAKNSFAYFVEDDEVFSKSCLANYGDGSFPVTLSYIGLLSKIGSVFSSDYLSDKYKKVFNRQNLIDKGNSKLDEATFCKVSELEINPDIAKNAPTPSFTYSIDESVVDRDIFKEIGQEQVFSPEKGIIISDTNQISINAEEKSLKVITSCSENFVLPGNLELMGHSVKVSSNNYCVVSVAAVDGKNIYESNRLLVLHISDVQATNTEYEDETHHRITSLGELPHLIRSSNADVRIKLKFAKNAKIWSVDNSGKRIEEIPFSVDGEFVMFTAKTTGYNKTTMSYEIMME